MNSSIYIILLLVLLAAAFLLIIFKYEILADYLNKQAISKLNFKSQFKRSADTHPGDYRKYDMTISEYALYTLIAAFAVSLLGYFFYRSIGLILCILPIAFFYPHIKRQELLRKQKHQLLLQFRDSLYLISSSLQTGRSIEGSFHDAYRELLMQYVDVDTFIIKEYEYINKRIQMNETIENALLDFAERSDIEEIQTFADVFQTCKRSGGNLIQVIRRTADVINEKIEIKQEIDTLLAERKFEQKVLMCMPVIVIFLVSTSAEDFIRPIFTTIQGRAAMTIALGLIMGAYYLSKQITDIEV